MTLKQQLEHSEKMRDLQAEYACKLEEKLRIATEALEYYAKSYFNNGENYIVLPDGKELRYNPSVAKDALTKIKE